VTPFRALAVLSGLLFACSPPPPGGDDGGSDGGPIPSAVEVGSGSISFVPLTDGDPVDIIKGPQGGYHIWMSLRASKQLDPKLIAVKYIVTELDGGEISLNASRLNLQANGDTNDWYGLQGLLPNPAAVSGREVLLRIEAEDSAKKTAVDQRRVIPRGP
jgi:hypothetical protein